MAPELELELKNVEKRAFFITFAVELAKVLEPIENIAERSWDESMRQVDAHLQRQVFTFYTTHLFEFTLCPPVIKRNFMNYPLSSFRRRNERRHLTMTFQELTCPSICVSLPSTYSARNLPADFQLPVLTRSHFIWNLLINSIRECRWRWLHSFWKYSPSECFCWNGQRRRLLFRLVICWDFLTFSDTSIRFHFIANE